jgi:hypothetical protein
MAHVSVAICCYNSAAYLDQTIKSVLNQTFKDWELVIVNDGSTDDTEQIVKRYINAGWPITYRYQANNGFASARNLCVELARGDYIALIDHDDICLPQRLAQQVDASARHPEAGLLFSDSEHFQDDGTILRRQFQSFPVDPCALDLGAQHATDQLLTYGCFIDTESVMFRRSVAQDVGGFNTAYRYIVDYDFFLRVGEKYPMFGDRQVLSRWRVHSRQASNTMRETIFIEHIDLYRRWLAKPTLNRNARSAVRFRLWKMLLLHSLFLASRWQLRAGCRRLSEAFCSWPSPQQALKHVSNRLIRNK